MRVANCPVDRPLYTSTTVAILLTWQAEPTPEAFAELWARFCERIKGRLQLVLLEADMRDGGIGWHDVDAIVMRLFWQACSTAPLKPVDVGAHLVQMTVDGLQAHLRELVAWRKSE